MNVLALAPYPELIPIIEGAARNYPALDITIAQGNLDEALVSALTVFHKDYDAVLSRGGTADSLEEQFSLPVVSIGVSAVDIMRCLASLDAAQDRVAAVGFSSILTSVPTAAELLSCPIACFPFDYEDELDDTLDEVERQGYRVILGDTASCLAARTKGLEAHLLSSGPESVQDALDTLQLVLSAQRKSAEHVNLLRNVIRMQGVKLAIYSNGTLTHSTLSESESWLLDTLAKRACETEPPERLLLRHEGTLYTVRALVCTHADSRAVTFTVASETVAGKDRLVGISYRSKHEVEQAYRNSTFCAVGAETELGPILTRAGKSPRPVIISGETGSGKPRAGQLMYLLGPYVNQPLIEINCNILDDRSWEFLINNYRSPLYESGVYLLIRSVHMLSEQHWRELLGTIEQTGLAGRCKLVFTFNLREDGQEPEALYQFSELLGGLSITIPPLRNLHVISTAPERYLAICARRDGRETPMLDRDASEILAAYHWPRNIMQFKQIMNWCYTAADTIITADIVRNALEHDAAVRFSSTSTPEQSSMLDVLRPLSETTAEIAHMAVDSCGGNKTLAAKKLGISRTTLWNLLKKGAQA